MEEFQSTPPMQGATVGGYVTVGNTITVSIHAPYAGSDLQGIKSLALFLCFNPRPLCRERLGETDIPDQHGGVSIHAPYAGSDFSAWHCSHYMSSFNPRPLCRERPVPIEYDVRIVRFQSTPPMQGATKDIVMCPQDNGFNPRPLCRERQNGT